MMEKFSTQIFTPRISVEEISPSPLSKAVHIDRKTFSSSILWIGIGDEFVRFSKVSVGTFLHLSVLN